MAFVGDVVSGLELLGKTGYFIWEGTRTSLDLNIENKHPHLVLQDFIRYARTGRCSRIPDFKVKPTQNTLAQFEARKSSIQLKGSMIYRIDKLKGENPNTKHLYVLLAWKIKIGGKSYFTLDLVESVKDAFTWNESRLEALYTSYTRKQFEGTGATLKRSWALNSEDESTWFSVSVNMTDVRSGVMNVVIEEYSSSIGAMKQPFLVETEKVKVKSSNSSSGPKRSIFGSSFTLELENNCDGLMLRDCEVEPFEGKRDKDKPGEVGPRSSASVKVKSAGIMFARTSGCISLELVRHSSSTPLMWGRKVHLVVDALVIPHDPSKRKASITLLTVKDEYFPHSTKALEHAHEEMLSHIMSAIGVPEQLQLDELNINMKVEFKMKPHAVLHVVLDDMKKPTSYSMPTFLPTTQYSIPSERAKEKVDAYIENNALTKPGLVFVDNTCSSGILVEPILSDQDMEHPPLLYESIKDGMMVENGQLFQNGYCLCQLYPSENGNYRQQLYVITSKKKIKEGLPYRCLLNIQSSQEQYITSVLYARRDKRPNKELRQLAAYFLNNADLTKGTNSIISKEVEENTYKSMHLMERPIRLPCNSTGHLTTYQAIKPPHLLTISLQDTFNAKSLYKRMDPKAAVPESPLPYHLTVRLANQLSNIPLEWVDFVSTGVVTVDSQLLDSNVIAPSGRAQYGVDFPWQDKRHSLLLRFKLDSTSGTYIDVHVNLATDSSWFKQTTIVKYKSGISKPVLKKSTEQDSFELVTNHRVTSNNRNEEEEEEDDDANSMDKVNELKVQNADVKQFMAIQHSTFSQQERHFSVVLSIAESEDMAVQSTKGDYPPSLDIKMMKAA